MSEQLEPLATEAGQQAIVRAINNLSSLEYAVRAEHAATEAAQSADEALISATNASNSQTKARDWAEKTNGAVETETIITPPETEGDPPTEELVSYFSAKYWAQAAQDYLNQMSLDTAPTEDSTHGITSGAVYDALATKQDTLTFDNAPTQNSVNPVKSGGVYSALDTKADKSTTYTKTEVDTALSGKADQSTTYTKTEVDTALGNVQSTLTFDNVPTQNSNNPVKSGGIYTALLSKADSSSVPTKVSDLTNDSGFITGVAWNDVTSKPTFANVATSGSYTDLTDKPTIPPAYTLPTASSSTLGGIKVGTNLSIDANGVLSASAGSNVTVDTSITENSTNPVTSAAIYEALQNFTPSGGGGGAGNASGMIREELYNGTPQGNGTLQLSEQVDKYDFIEFRVVNNTSSMVHHLVPCYVSVPLLLRTKQIDTGGSNTNMYIQYEYGNRWAGIQVNASDNSKLTISNANEHLIKEVYGIKFPKNLSEQMYSNVLYEDSSGFNSGNITLSDSIENYDFLCLVNAYSQDNPLAYTNHYMDINDVKKDYTKQHSFATDSSRFIVFSFPNTSTFKVERSGGNQKIYKIIGYKMAQGGYSGIVSDARMTVKSGSYTHNQSISSGQEAQINITFDSPMPDTNYYISLCRTDTIAEYGISAKYKATAKTINGFTLILYADGYNVGAGYSVDWIAIRPNSYTREGMVEDVLYTSSSGFTTGTINLSGNISDYDLIEFVIGDSIDGEKYTNNRVYSSSVLTNIMGQQNKFFHLAYYNGGWQMLSVDSDNQLSCSNRSGNTVLYKITGIKFGKYVGNVAIDSTVTQNGTGLVTGSAVYDAIQTALNSITNANGVSY